MCFLIRCNWLICASIYRHDEMAAHDPAEFLASLGSEEQSERCGHCFLDGEIVWNCKTCQVDDTCVLCDKCFHNSDHRGHDVRFHRTRAGGCCDCGDPEAWAPEGFCNVHGKPHDTRRPIPTISMTVCRPNASRKR